MFQNAARLEPALGSRVELLRIEQAGTSGFDRGRRINEDDVILLLGAFQVAASIINNDVRKR